MAWLGLAFAAGIGLCLGSFVNALEWRLRLHRRKQGADDESEDVPADVTPLRAVLDCLLGAGAELLDWLAAPLRLLRRRSAKLPHAGKAQQTDKYSIATGRSMCPHCEHELAPRDLVPLASWLWLRGRCRYCHKPIGRQYPLIELLTMVLFAASYLAWPFGQQGYGLVALAVWLVMLTGFVALGLYDAKWHYLPNELLYPLMWLMVLWLGLEVVFGPGWGRLAGAAWGVLVLWGSFFVIYCCGEALGRPLIGYGDVRLGVLLGLLVGGPLAAVTVMFAASLLGTLAIAPLLIKGTAQRSSQIPYGPFLLLAGAVVFVFGPGLSPLLVSVLIGR